MTLPEPLPLDNLPLPAHEQMTIYGIVRIQRPTSSDRETDHEERNDEPYRH